MNETPNRKIFFYGQSWFQTGCILLSKFHALLFMILIVVQDEMDPDTKLSLFSWSCPKTRVRKIILVKCNTFSFSFNVFLSLKKNDTQFPPRKCTTIMHASGKNYGFLDIKKPVGLFFFSLVRKPTNSQIHKHQLVLVAGWKISQQSFGLVAIRTADRWLQKSFYYLAKLALAWPEPVFPIIFRSKNPDLSPKTSPPDFFIPMHFTG